MWVLYAFGSAFFAGVTAILAKLGIRKTDSTVATAIRTIVVLLFTWLIVLITHVGDQISSISPKSLLFLILSGLATGASWLCYFHALSTGPVAQVAAVDKLSVVLTILLSFLLLHETVSVCKILGTIMIALGTWMMLDPDPFAKYFQRKKNPQSAPAARSKKEASHSSSKSWLLYAAASAVFASLTSILGKVGIENVDSNLGTALRTIVVLIMAWVMVFVTKKQDTIRKIPPKELLFICLSGAATGASWLCFYAALQQGEASIVIPIDKLSILVTVLFSWIVFHEHLSKKALAGLLVLTAGTLIMLL